MAEFYTRTSPGTLINASGLTVIVTNTIQYIFGLPDVRWLGLLVAEAISLVTAYYLVYVKATAAAIL
jgi:hypothetical protein